MSKVVFDLRNDLVSNPFWNPQVTHSSNQHLIPLPEGLASHIPFSPALATDVFLQNIPLAKTDGYLDDGITVALDLPTIIDCAVAALPLVLHLLFRPFSKEEPIHRTNVLFLQKVAMEGTLRELIKYIRWLTNTPAFTIALPQDKAAEWLNQIDQLIAQWHPTFADLDSTIGQLNHVGFIIPNTQHFLSRIHKAKILL